MKVVSKLVDLELHIGSIEQHGRELRVHSDPQRSMPTTIHIAPSDVLEILKVILRSSGLWTFLLLLPWYCLGPVSPSVTAGKAAGTTPPPTGPEKWDPWD